MRVDYAFFKSRQERSDYIVKAFGNIIKGTVLEIGCDMALLKQLIPNLKYTGVDISGAPDLTLNLEKIERLPFEDNSFDWVVCTDVLEHLDNLHFIFGELVRVSSRYLLISLPNNWVNLVRPIERGSGSFDKFGLPSNPVKDRHKWFFNLTEASNFIKAQTEKYPIYIRELLVTEKPKPFYTRMVRRVFYPRYERYLNRYANTLWVVLEKNSFDPRR